MQITCMHIRSSVVRGAAAVALLTLTACGAADEDSGDHNSGDRGGALLPKPAQGVQLHMSTELEAGVEAEHCQFYRVPEDQDLWVHDSDTKYNAGSHHVLLYRTPYKEIPTETNYGEKLDMTGTFDCSEGAFGMLDVTSVVTGSQNFKGGDSLNFPPGVAMRVEAGTLLLINAHIINTQMEKQKPQLTINLETIDERDVKEEGGLLFFYNFFIHAGAKSKGEARARCTITDDIMLLNAQSHMHSQGVGYQAIHRSADGKSETIYENDSWEDVPIDTFGKGHAMKPGDALEFACQYDNKLDQPVFQGGRTTDEMCMFIGNYYPRNMSLDDCAAAGGRGQIGLDWVGSGSATCNDSLDCAIAGILKDRNDLQQISREVSKCVQASDASVATELSAAIRCFGTAQSPLSDCEEQLNSCRSM